LLVSQIASCFAAMTWGLLSYHEDGRVQITHIASGALCGLAGITPGSGFVLPIAGVPIGILTGLAGWYGSYLVTSQVKLDDVLDVTSLQAFPGALGSILVGFFATTDAHGCQVPTFPGRECNRGSNKNMGIFYGGNGELLAYQIAAVLTMITWAAALTWVTMKIIAMTTGLNVTAEDEELGLDLAYHGEKAYDLEEHDDLEDMAKIVKLINAVQSGDKAEVLKVITRFGVDPTKVDVDGKQAHHVLYATHTVTYTTALSLEACGSLRTTPAIVLTSLGKRGFVAQAGPACISLPSMARPISASSLSRVTRCLRMCQT